MKEFLSAVLDFSPLILLAFAVFLNARRERKNPRNIKMGYSAYIHSDASQDLMSQVSGTARRDGSISPLYYSNQQNRDHF